MTTLEFPPHPQWSLEYWHQWFVEPSKPYTQFTFMRPDSRDMALWELSDEIKDWLITNEVTFRVYCPLGHVGSTIRMMIDLADETHAIEMKLRWDLVS
jgi:hypothetical protein